VQGSGFRVQGAGFRVQGSGFGVQGAGCRIWAHLDACECVIDARHLDLRLRVQSFGFRV
jgi:hypothetical protein